MPADPLAHAREIIGAMTAGPWTPRRRYVNRPAYDETAGLGLDIDPLSRSADARGIAYLRNVIEPLLDLVEAAQDYLGPHPSASHPGGGGDPDAQQRLARLRAALARAMEALGEKQEPPGVSV